MQRLIVIAVCVLLTSPAWADGPSFPVSVDIDLVGNANPACKPWEVSPSGPACHAPFGGSMGTRRGTDTSLRIPLFWDGTGAELRFMLTGWIQPTYGNPPAPDNQFDFYFSIQTGDGVGTEVYFKEVFVPYPTENETVEVNVNLDDLTSSSVTPGELYALRIYPHFTNWPDGWYRYGGVVFTFTAALPITGGDCNFDGVVDAADMSCVVNAVFD